MFDHARLDLVKPVRRSACRAQQLRSTRVLLATAASLCLLAAACGSDSEPEEGASSTIAESVTTESSSTETSGAGSERTIVTTDEDTDGDSDDEETTTTTEDAASTTTEAGEDDDGPAGEALDFGPSPGTPLAIVGVAFDDTLNFRDSPAPDADVLASFGPLSGDLDTSALGEAWAAPSGVWWKVDVGGTEAWANQAFLGSLGTTSAAFDEIAAELVILKFETVEAAALAVAEVRSSDDPLSDIVFSGEPLLFETGGFAIVDVIGLGDDSIKGFRIRVEVETVFDEASGEEGAQDVAFVVLSDVEITPICGRGVSDGLCT